MEVKGMIYLEPDRKISFEKDDEMEVSEKDYKALKRNGFVKEPIKERKTVRK